MRKEAKKERKKNIKNRERWKIWSRRGKVFRENLFIMEREGGRNILWNIFFLLRCFSLGAKTFHAVTNNASVITQRRFSLKATTQITAKLLALVIYLIEIDARDLLFNRGIAKIYAFQLKFAPVLLALFGGRLDGNRKFMASFQLINSEAIFLVFNVSRCLGGRGRSWFQFEAQLELILHRLNSSCPKLRLLTANKFTPTRLLLASFSNPSSTPSCFMSFSLPPQQLFALN